MQFIECAYGRYQIYAGALADPAGRVGFVATLVIKVHSEDGLDELEAFGDLSLIDGMVWANERDALYYAVRRGEYVIDARPALLARISRRPPHASAADGQQSILEHLSNSSPA